MNAASSTERHDLLVKELAIERTELGREIREGNYMRAAMLADYISKRLLAVADVVKDDKE